MNNVAVGREVVVLAAAASIHNNNNIIPTARYTSKWPRPGWGLRHAARWNSRLIDFVVQLAEVRIIIIIISAAAHRWTTIVVVVVVVVMTGDCWQEKGLWFVNYNIILNITSIRVRARARGGTGKRGENLFIFVDSHARDCFFFRAKISKYFNYNFRRN